MDLRVRYQPATEDISEDDGETSDNEVEPGEPAEPGETGEPGERVKPGETTKVEASKKEAIDNEVEASKKTDIALHNWAPWRPWTPENASLSENENNFANFRVKLEFEEGGVKVEESEGEMENAKTANFAEIKKEPADDSEAIADDVFHLKGAQEIGLFPAIIKTEIEMEVTVEEREPPPQENVEKENLEEEYFGTGLPNNLTEPEMSPEKETPCFAEKRFKCNQCNYSSKYISHLKTHKMVHEGKKPFKCDQCEYTASSQSHIERHKKKHNNGGESTRRKIHKGSPLSCSQCQFKCHNAINLKAHKKAHLGKLAFICDQCDYLASCAGNLQRHMMKHSGEKPFKCDLCDYSASNAHHVRTHKRKHSGEKPFKCDQCDFAASRIDNLNVHKRNNHFGEILSRRREGQ